MLLVPPDHTRLHSRGGEIAGFLFETLTAAGCEVAVLPALGTHAAMTPHEAELLFGGRIPFDRILRHRWRDGLVRLGEIGADEISALSGGRLTDPIPVEVDEVLLDGWDLVVSVGQVGPHEVIGMANFTKNLVIGLGGAPTIHLSHFLGAVCDMETIMGRAHSPVRDVVDAAFDRFLAAPRPGAVAADRDGGHARRRRAAWALRRPRRLRRFRRRRLRGGRRAVGRAATSTVLREPRRAG